MLATPKKKPPPANTGTAKPTRSFSAAAPRTPAQFRTTSRFPSISPQKPSTLRTSPSKRPPSSVTFAPALPAKTPVYPALRAPRRDESMLSINGSPIVNPYQLGLDWFATQERDGIDGTDVKKKGKGKETQLDTLEEGKTLRRVNSIVIRRDPSVSLVPSSATRPSSSQTHSRTNSQTQTNFRTHSRTNSRTPAPPVPEPPTPKSATLAFPPSSHPSQPSSSSARAVVAITTSDGHVLEFDPLQTSPRALDALVGITDSAKKHAREEMGRLVQAAVSKWSIT
jgi:hypothetical protein